MKNIIMLVFRKELVDIFRDKKTMIMSIIIPLILFPALFGFMGKSMDKTKKQVEENLKVAVVDNGSSTLSSYLKEQKNIKITESTNAESDVKEGKLLVAVDIPKDFDENVGKEAAAKITIIYDNSSQQSQMAFQTINNIIGTYNQKVVAERLLKRNINVEILSPVTVETKTSVKENEGEGKLMLTLLLPLLLFIYCVTGPMGSAIDLGAGEKERGTLEPLLTTQAGRISLLWGKFLAITVVGLITTVASLIGMFVGMARSGDMFGGVTKSSGIGIEPASILLVGVIAIMVTMVFGALELSISIYARSFKEAQTYVTPLMIVGFIPAYATYMLDAKNLDMGYFHIPMVNAVCLMKEFIAGIFNYTHMFITFGWMIVYIVAAILVARYMFSREEVIFRT